MFDWVLNTPTYDMLAFIFFKKYCNGICQMSSDDAVLVGVNRQVYRKEWGSRLVFYLSL